MKKIVASVLAVIFILSSISGACTPVFASESLVENGSESVLDEGIPTDSAMDLYEEENSFEISFCCHAFPFDKSVCMEDDVYPASGFRRKCNGTAGDCVCISFYTDTRK